MAEVGDMKVLAPTMRLKGGCPRSASGPTIRRPLGRRARVARGADDVHGQGRGQAHLRKPQASERPRSRMRVADGCIGGVAEAAACAEKFSREGVAVTLTVTPCWCYGSETMDMDPLTVKAVWGFNGTDRPGAVYLAAVLAAHNQKGLPAFGIYGRDVQDLKDTETIPADVAEKILRFARVGPRRRLDARQVLPFRRLGLDGHRRLHRRPRLLPGLPRHAQRVRRHERDRTAASRRGSTPTPNSSGPSNGSRPTARKARTSTPPTCSIPATARTRPGP